jgi:hypothetical protein
MRDVRLATEAVLLSNQAKMLSQKWKEVGVYLASGLAFSATTADL